MRVSRHWLVASLIGLILLSSSATAATVTGRVRDTSTNTYLFGASVSIPELNLTATSGAGGSFNLGDVPAGTYTLEVQYLGYSTDTRTVTVGNEPKSLDIGIESDVVKLGDFVVEGSRAGQAMALQQKRTSNNIMDAVSADAVGKFPDGNAAESLRRVPGVSLEIDQSEGRYVIVRGIDSALNTVTLNGQLIGSPSEKGNRGIAMDSVPSDLIARLEVVKAVTPDMDGSAIGGSINIVTQSAFDRAEGFFYGSLLGGYNDFSDRWSPAGSLSYGKVLGEDQRWGVVAGISYSERHFSSQTSDASGWGLQNGYYVPDEQESFNYDIDRKRLGANVALEFHPSEDQHYALRVNHNRFTDNEGRQKTNNNFGRGKLTNQTATSGDFSQGRATREFRDYYQIGTINAVSLEGKQVLAADYHLNWQVGASLGERETPRRVDWEFRSSGSAFPNHYDLTGDIPIITPSANFYDPASYPFRRARFRHDMEKEKVNTGQVDLRRDLNLSEKNAYWKVGVKYITRTKNDDRENSNYNATGAGFNLAESGLALAEPANYFRGKYRFGPQINLPNLQQYFASTPGQFKYDPLGSEENSLASDFHASEDVTAAYLMGSVDLNKEWTLLGGVRLEHTKATYAANELEYDDGDFTGVVHRIKQGNDYNNWMPGLHLNWHPNDKFVVRAAWTNTIGRPNYSDLAPTRELDSVDTGGGVYEGSLSTGNPELKPYESMNFDLTVEYYLKNAGILSLGAFHKSIDNPIYGFSEVQTNVTVNGRTYSRLGVSRPENADKGKITGVELNYQQFFTVLPSPFDGLGVNFNYTLTDSSVTVFGRSDELPFFKQSDEVGNIALVYEKYGIQARVAMSFNSAYLVGVGSKPENDEYIARRRPIDAKLSYRINSKLTVFAEFLNIDEQPLRNYQGEPSRSVGDEIYSWNANLGINFNL